MTGENNPINSFKRLNNFFPLMLGHKDISLLGLEPIVIVYYHHKFIAHRFGLIEHSDMANVYRIKTSGDGHYDFSSFFKFLCALCHVEIYTILKGNGKTRLS